MRAPFRPPPTRHLQDPRAERAALRALLRFPAPTVEAASAAGFEPSHLYQHPHVLVWKGARFVAGPGRGPVDLVGLYRELGRRRELPELGPSPALFLADLFLADAWLPDLAEWWQDHDDRLPLDVGLGQAALHKLAHLAARRWAVYRAAEVTAAALSGRASAAELVRMADALGNSEEAA